MKDVQFLERRPLRSWVHRRFRKVVHDCAKRVLPRPVVVKVLRGRFRRPVRKITTFFRGVRRCGRRPLHRWRRAARARVPALFRAQGQLVVAECQATLVHRVGRARARPQVALLSGVQVRSHVPVRVVRGPRVCKEKLLLRNLAQDELGLVVLPLRLFRAREHLAPAILWLCVAAVAVTVHRLVLLLLLVRRTRGPHRAAARGEALHEAHGLAVHGPMVCLRWHLPQEEGACVFELVVVAANVGDGGGGGFAGEAHALVAGPPTHRGLCRARPRTTRTAAIALLGSTPPRWPVLLPCERPVRLSVLGIVESEPIACDLECSLPLVLASCLAVLIAPLGVSSVGGSLGTTQRHRRFSSVSGCMRCSISPWAEGPKSLTLITNELRCGVLLVS